MGWVVTGDPVAFAAAAADLLVARRLELTAIAGIVQRLAEVGPDAYGDGAPVLARWVDPATGSVTALAVRTPPRPLVVSALPPAALATLVAAVGPVDAATGPEAEALGVVAASGRTPRVAVRERLHRLGRLAPLVGVEGRARVADTADGELVRAWVAAFHTEVFPLEPPPRAARVDAGVSAGRFVLWIDGDGPRAVAGTSLADGCGRIGPVYTPPAWRGRGYAAGATTAAASLLRGRGAEEVVLFSDLANATSTALYARLGFSPVADQVEVVS